MKSTYKGVTPVTQLYSWATANMKGENNEDIGERSRLDGTSNNGGLLGLSGLGLLAVREVAEPSHCSSEQYAEHGRLRGTGEESDAWRRGRMKTCACKLSVIYGNSTSN